jgi:hypothetical protein
MLRQRLAADSQSAQLAQAGEVGGIAARIGLSLPVMVTDRLALRLGCGTIMRKRQGGAAPRQLGEDLGVVPG